VSPKTDEIITFFRDVAKFSLSGKENYLKKTLSDKMKKKKEKKRRYKNKEKELTATTTLKLHFNTVQIYFYFLFFIFRKTSLHLISSSKLAMNCCPRE